MRGGDTWTTSDEIAYLRGIGSWRPPREQCRIIDQDDERPGRPALLARYIESIGRRSVWGSLDRERILFEAQQLANQMSAP